MVRGIILNLLLCHPNGAASGTISANPQILLSYLEPEQSSQVPRTSMTGRLAAKPASAAASRIPPDNASLSMWTACPQLSQIRKMQS
jgi:hypothetical protein